MSGDRGPGDTLMPEHEPALLEPLRASGVLPGSASARRLSPADSEAGAFLVTYEDGSEAVLKMSRASYRHSGKVNGLVQEIDILERLDAGQAVCAPRVLRSAEARGYVYVFLRRVPESPDMRATPTDVLFAFLELKSFGYLHGDMHGRKNTLFDGVRVCLIDFDQTVRCDRFPAMSMAEVCQWSKDHKQEPPWPRCYTLEDQLRLELQACGYYAAPGEWRLSLDDLTLLREGLKTRRVPAINGRHVVYAGGGASCAAWPSDAPQMDPNTEAFRTALSHIEPDLAVW